MRYLPVMQVQEVRRGIVCFQRRKVLRAEMSVLCLTPAGS